MSDDKADERSEMWAGALDNQDDEDGPDTQDEEDPQDPMDAQGPWDVESIRDAWHPNSVRLPDPLQRRFQAYHSRVESELTLDGLDRPYGKDRYYKPLVVALGLRELDAMDTADVLEALDELERTGHLEE